MMRQPLIGWQFTTFVPLALVPYMLLLALGAFNPLVGGISRLFSRSSAKLTVSEKEWGCWDSSTLWEPVLLHGPCHAQFEDDCGSHICPVPQQTRLLCTN